MEQARVVAGLEDRAGFGMQFLHRGESVGCAGAGIAGDEHATDLVDVGDPVRGASNR